MAKLFILLAVAGVVATVALHTGHSDYVTTTGLSGIIGDAVYGGWPS